jgi:hypothetical protein
MLKISFSSGPWFVRCALFASAIGLGVWGCQGPDAFYRNGDASVVRGTGGVTTGAGGGTNGTGGVTGGGGTLGTGGRGTGGIVGTGGTLGGTGGRLGTGGAPVGTGGRIGTGGVVGGVGGAIGTGGSPAGVGGATGTDAAVGGTGPCMGLCATPIVFTTAMYNSGSLGTGATCHETTANLQGGGCSNCTGRTFSINGTLIPQTSSNWPSLPAKVNGGYCLQAGAGGVDYASFYTF